MLTEDAKRLGIHPSQKGLKDKVGDVLKKITGSDEVKDEPVVVHNTADESEGVVVKVDYDDITMPELRKLADKVAKEKGVRPIKSREKADIINFIKNNK